MKTSIDLPQELYHQIQYKSALEGRTVQDIAVALFSKWLLDSPRTPALGEVSLLPSTPAAAREQWLVTWKELAAQVSQATEGRGGLVEQVQSDRG